MTHIATRDIPATTTVRRRGDQTHIDTDFKDKKFAFAGDIKADGRGGKVAVGSAARNVNTVFAKGEGGGLIDSFAVRYRADGLPDARFGKNGVTSWKGTALATAATPDGGMVIVDEAREKVRLLKLDARGRFDKNFGDGGHVTLARTAGSDGEYRGFDVAVQRSGRIVVLDAQPENVPNVNSELQAFDSSGRIDRSFGTNGRTPLRGSPQWLDRPNKVVIGRDDSVYLAGEARSRPLQAPGSGADSPQDGLVTRLDRNGAPDRGFGDFGSKRIDFGTRHDGITGLAERPDGSLAFAGTKEGSMMLGALLLNGQLDTRFSKDGLVDTRLDDSGFEGSSVVARPNGGMIASTPGGLIARNADGSTDRTFGRNGRIKSTAHTLPSEFPVRVVASGPHIDYATTGFQGSADPWKARLGIHTTRVHTDK